MSPAKKYWIVAAAVAVLGVIVFVSIRATRKERLTVQTTRVQRKELLTSKVTASGEIRAKEFVDLQSEIAGVITELPIREGNRVKKGDVLLKIDPIQTAADSSATRAQYEASMAEARAQEFQIYNAETGLARDQAALLSSRAEVEQAEGNFGKVQRSFARKQQLNEDGLVSREEYEAAQNDLKVSKLQLDMANARLVQMETQIKTAKNTIEQMKVTANASMSRAKSAAANVTRASDQLKKTTLYSPINGVVTQLLVEKGERAVPGVMSNPQATLMTIADLSVIQAELKVDETDVINLAIGDPAAVKVDALPDMVFEGEVTEIGNSPINASAGSTQEAKDFKVIVTLKSPSTKLRPGMSCTGDITTDTRKNVLVIPVQALTVREVEIDKDGDYHEPDLKKKPTAAMDPLTKKKELEGVFVVTKDQIARFRVVKTGITGDSEIEILNNLTEGEEVVSGSFQTLRTIKDGAGVKPDNSSAPNSPKS